MKGLYLALGFFFFGLGALGAVLPVLPTTPFLLLASGCFAKGSDRYHRWFQSTKLYEKHLASFYEHRAMTRKTKVTLLTFATSVMVLSLLGMPNIYGRLFMLSMIVFLHYYFHFKIHTIKPPLEE